MKGKSPFIIFITMNKIYRNKFNQRGEKPVY